MHVGECENGRRVFWCGEFPDEAAHQGDLDARERSAEFEAVRARMRELIEHFDRCVLRETGNGVGVLSTRSLAEHPVAPRVVRFPAHGRELEGYLYLPPGEGPFPMILLLS